MSKSQYEATLDYLYSQLPMYQRVGAVAFKKDLTNIRALCEYLGQPQEQFPSIHIAGTNGKGSTAHMAAAVFSAAGYKTGLYTSPHYRDFRERVKVNGALMEREYVIGFVEAHHLFFEQLKPSFFEITVAMAFDYFARQQVDIAVVEVGLGGRLDSTNIILPLLSVITNISFDHQQFLGNTLPEIAGEKAGIIKQGVPVVIGETQPEVELVFKEKAAQEEAPIVFADQHVKALLKEEGLEFSTYDVYVGNQLALPGLLLNAHGPYQHKNLQTLLQALRSLPEKWRPDERAIRLGLKELRERANFLGRWQLLGEKPTILCDSAHNEAGLRVAVEALEKQTYDQLHIVLGMVSDKDAGKALRHFPEKGKYYFAKPDVPRGLEATQLQETAAKLGRIGKAYSSVKEALEAARRAARENDLIYVGGSIFVVAEVV
jgi:dihydrofolate synthase/folylpolyglutamate synthase